MFTWLPPVSLARWNSRRFELSRRAIEVSLAFGYMLSRHKDGGSRQELSLFGLSLI